MANARDELPEVTAIVPMYNMERFVERSLRSALGQSHPRLRVLVVDDGSTDRGPAICREIAAADPRVEIVSGPNCGLAATRNRGIDLARSPYVAFLDADDLWHPRKIERQVDRLLSHGSGDEWAACYALFRMIDEHDRVLIDGFASGPSGSFFERHLLGNHVGNGSSLLVRRAAALEVGGFDPEYAARGIGGCEDYDFQLKLLRRYRIDLVPEYLVGYRISEGQMSRQRTRMGRGMIAVVGKFADGGEVSPRLRRAALASAHRYAAAMFLLGGDWRNWLRSAATVLALAPLGGLAAAVRFVGRKAKARAARLVTGPARRAFQDADPCERITA